MAQQAQQKNTPTDEPKKKHTMVSKYKNFHQSVGKRKSAVARVRMTEKDSQRGIIINDKPLDEYFTYFGWRKIVRDPLKLLGMDDKYHISIKVAGGGPNGQAEAIRHGISRILDSFDEAHHKPLKAAGFLTRDPRVKERKKPGLKRARRAPQWQKR